MMDSRLDKLVKFVEENVHQLKAGVKEDCKFVESIEMQILFVKMLDLSARPLKTIKKCTE